MLRAGRTRPGTTFEASAAYRGHTYRVRSSRWRGRVKAIARPRLIGEPRVGMRVTPIAGSWRGGWGDERDLLSLVACRTRNGRGCVTIAHPRVPGSLRRPIHARWSGYYLFAYDVREPAKTLRFDLAYRSPESIAVPRLGATVARSLPLGPVRDDAP